MSNSYEFQGKSVEQALETASNALNIPVEAIKHEVVTYGSTGIFGLVGIKKAVINVFVEDPAPPAEKETPPPTAAATLTPQPAPPPEASATTGAATISPAVDETLVAFGTSALQTIVDEITSGAGVDVVQDGERLLFAVSGGESGVMIGKRGQTLEAIQYLLEKMINKKSTHRIRVLVDVEGYLEKRKKNLEQLAVRMAEKAQRIKKPVMIGQMNAHDRRIVHIHLKDQNSVRTQSIGDGYYRKLMIFPKKQGVVPRRSPK
jgi:spoIIIJ-associated protein